MKPRVRTEKRVRKTEVAAENGIVTAMHPLAAEVGVDVLERGGNAADAAIATSLAVGVVEPFMSGLGGALYALVYDARSGATRTYDGSCAVPGEAREDLFELETAEGPRLGVYGWRATRDDASETGYRSIAVPGAMAALERLHQDSATMSWEELAAPALRLAEGGFPVDEYLFTQTAASASRLRAFEGTTEIFFHRDGTAPVPSLPGTEPERLIQPALARSLRLLAREGPRSFYEGALAEAIVSHVRSGGGILSLDDLASYRAIEAPPLLVRYRGRDVELLPGPSGGPTVALALEVLGGFDLPALAPDSVERLHLVAEALRIAFVDRFELLADPDVEDVSIDELVSSTRAEERRRLLSPHGPRAASIGPSRRLRRGSGDAPGQHTTHLNTADRDGNLVSLTATLGARFGSGVTDPVSGIVLNNGMMWFDPEPGRLNSIKPGKRALHAAAPVLLREKAKPLLALGSPGARKIMSAVLQVLLQTIDCGAGIQDAIEAPRIHTETTPLLLVESLFGDAVARGLRERGYEVSVQHESFFSTSFGRPSGIAVDRASGCFRGGVEPHRVATAVGY